MKKLVLLLTVIILCCTFLVSTSLRQASAADCSRTSTGMIPISDLGSGTYHGFTGGLYPNGTNQIPADHLAAGLERARRIRPLDANGSPSPSGKYVLLSIGMSNTTQEFSAFKPLADADPGKNPNLVIVDGAQGGRDASEWTSPTATVYDVIRDQRLSSLQVTERQVQAVWLKQANARPTASLPNTNADAYNLERNMGMIVRALKVRYPNLQQVFISSRIYAGYASSALNPEPYAYESGFSVKWLVEAQINQMRGAPPDSTAGDLNYNTIAPWIAWGPYMWADGVNARSDGLTYLCSDFANDGTHPATSARQKVAGMLLDFFKNDNTARLWFLNSRRGFSDFDGDGKADLSVFRPSDRIWYINRSAEGFQAVQFGLSADRLAPADFDGDGRADIAVFRDGTWYWINSSSSSIGIVQFGLAGDVPVPSDYTGDGRSELAVYRGGVWYTLDLMNNQFQAVQFGVSTDKPVTGDYDGDGKTDFAVYRDGVWYLLQSTQGFTAFQFGLAADKPVVSDYDGDGKTDAAVYRGGVWYLLRSTQGFAAFQFGLASDVPAPADFDGDGKADAAVYRDGIWYLLRSEQGFLAAQFGLTGDLPIPSAFVP